VLKRSQAAQKIDKDWFNFCLPLSIGLASDYIALRILYRLEPLTTALTIVGKSLDVAEKSLKLFVIVSRKSPRALWSARSEFGHDIEKLRIAASQLDPDFDDPAIRSFTRDLNDKSGKLYQQVRYGSEETTSGFKTNLHALIPVVDRIYFRALTKLPPGDRRMFVLGSPIKALIRGEQWDQTRNRNAVMGALRFRNAELAGFEVLCEQLEAEEEAMKKRFETLLAQPPPSTDSDGASRE
jgi:hypothetical protein